MLKDFIIHSQLEVVKLKYNNISDDTIMLLTEALLLNATIRKFVFLTFMPNPEPFLTVIKRRYYPVKIILQKGGNDYTACNGSLIKY